MSSRYASALVISAVPSHVRRRVVHARRRWRGVERRGGGIATTASATPTPHHHHHGIVDDEQVHGSSLVATRLSPPRVVPKPLIYLNATCPFAQKAWIALLEKDVDFDARFEDLANKSPEMCATYGLATPDPSSPAKVPIFVHEGHVMIESALVAKYVATAFPTGNDIVPASPSEEYAGAIFAETFNAITPQYFKALRAQSQEEVDGALDGVREVLKASERALHVGGGGGDDRDGPYAAGARYTIADVITSTMIPRVSVVLRHFRGFHLEKEVEGMGLTRLHSWMTATMERPSMKASLKRAAEEHGTDLDTALIEHSQIFVSWPK